MAEVLKGKVVADKIKEDMAKKINDLAKEGKTPTLGIVRLGENPSDISYEKSIIKTAIQLE